MGHDTSHRQCSTYECAWETRPEYLTKVNLQPKAMFRIFRDEYLSADRHIERRLVNASAADGNPS